MTKRNLLTVALVAVSALVSLPAFATSFQMTDVSVGQQIQFRGQKLGKVGGVISIYTTDGFQVAIVCSRAMIPIYGKSSADLVLSNGSEVPVDRYKDSTGEAVGGAHYIPLEATSAKIICNKPAGEYVVEVRKDGKYRSLRWLKTIETDSADSHNGDRGY